LGACGNSGAPPEPKINSSDVPPIIVPNPRDGGKSSQVTPSIDPARFALAEAAAGGVTVVPLTGVDVESGARKSDESNDDDRPPNHDEETDSAMPARRIALVGIAGVGTAFPRRADSSDILYESIGR
jgi:hypothetical protein